MAALFLYSGDQHLETHSDYRLVLAVRRRELLPSICSTPHQDRVRFSLHQFRSNRNSQPDKLSRTSLLSSLRIPESFRLAGSEEVVKLLPSLFDRHCLEVAWRSRSEQLTVSLRYQSHNL